MKYDVIIFDLGNVIFKFDHAIAARGLSRLSGMPTLELVIRYVSSGLGELFDEGKLSPEEFFRKVSEDLKLNISYEEFKKIWNEIFYEAPKINELIFKLRAKYRIFVLSDTNELHFNYLKDNFPILNYIDGFILSYKEGVKKPDHKIFEIALERAETTADRAIYIDDRAENVKAARELGIESICFKSEKDLEKSLLELGIEVA